MPFFFLFPVGPISRSLSWTVSSSNGAGLVGRREEFPRRGRRGSSEQQSILLRTLVLLLENQHHPGGLDFPKISGREIAIVDFGVDLGQLLVGAREAGDGNSGGGASNASIPVPLSANRGRLLPNVRFEITGHGNGRTGDHTGTDIGRPRAVDGIIDFERMGKDAPIIDDPAILRGMLDALKGGNGHGRQQADDNHHDHDFHQRKSAGER